MSVVGSVSSKYYSGFNPLDIGDCALWLDAADSNSVTETSGSITNVTNKGNSSIVLSNANGFTYDRTNRAFTNSVASSSRHLGINSSYSQAQPQTLFAVASFSSSSTNPYIIDSRSTQVDVGRFGYSIVRNIANTADVAYAFAGNIQGPDYGLRTQTNISSNTTVLHTLVMNNSSSDVRLNGVTQSWTQSPGTNSMTGITVANRYSDNQSWVGSINEILLYSRGLTLTERQTIEGYLARKWGLLGGGGVQSITTFNPTNVSGCQLWLDAADSNSLTLSSSSVTQWNDKSGNQRNFTQPTSGSRPTYVSNGLNNYPVVRFASTFLSNAGFPLYASASSGLSFFAVFNTTNRNQQTAILAQMWNGTDFTETEIGFSYRSGTGYSLANYGSIGLHRGNGAVTETASNAINSNVTYVYSAIASNTGSTPSSIGLFLNGTQNTSIDFNAGMSNGFYSPGSYPIFLNSVYLGARNDRGPINNYLAGDIAELILYNTAITSTDRQNIEGYLARKWGLTGSLPSTHPYALRGLPSTHPYYSIAPVTRAFAPIDIPGCALWLDAADPSTLTLSGTSVTQWRDKSGNGRNASTFQSSPTWANNLVTFNGTQGLQLSSPFFSANTQNVAIAIVWNCTTGSTNSNSFQGIIEQNPTYPPYGTGWRFMIYGNGFGGRSGNFYGLNEFGANPTPVANFPGFTVGTTNLTFISQTSTNGTNFTISNFAYGSLVGTQTHNTAMGAPVLATIGYNTNTAGGGEPFRGTISEIILYNTVLSTIQRQQVEAYLARKWGLLGGGGVQSITTFIPTSISGCGLWLDATDSSTLTFQSGNNVSVWTDKTTGIQAQYLTEAMAVARAGAGAAGSPNYPVSGYNINGRNALFFNQAILQAITTQSVTTRTYFLVINVVSPNSGGSLLWPATWVNNFARGGQIQTSSTNITFANQNVANLLNLAYTVGSSLVLSITFNNGTVGMWNTGGGTTSSTGQSSSVLGLSGSSDNYLWIGGVQGYSPTSGFLLGELLEYNSALSTTNRQIIEGYLALKWGLQSSLPSTHPYALRGLPSTHPYVYRLPATTVFNPRQISGCALWLDAADPSTLTLSGTSVTAWRDKSSNNYSSTVYNSPTYSSSSLNGFPGVTFNGSSQYISFGNIINLGTSPIYVFSVVKYDTTGDGTIIAKSSYRINSARWFLLRAAVDGGAIMGVDIGSGGVAAAFADTTTNVQLFSGFWDRSTVYVFQNGTQRSSTAAVNSSSLTNTDPLYIAAYPNSTGTAPNTTGGYTYLNGKIGEILVYNESITTAQRQQMEGYLAWKWGLNGGYSPSIAPFTPTSVSGCALWLDAADSSTFSFSSGSNISQWRDKSGNGYNAAVFTGTPTYSNSSVVFTGSQIFRTQLSSVLSSQTSFAVVTHASANTMDINSLFLDSAGTIGVQMSIDNNIQRLRTWGGTLVASGSTITQNTRFLNGFTFVAGGAAGTNFVYLNGSQTGSNTVTAPTLSGSGRIMIGGYYDSANGQMFNGTMSEIILFNRVLSTSERQQIEGYLANKWGLTGSLPSSHPYGNRSLPNTHPYKVIKP